MDCLRQLGCCFRHNRGDDQDRESEGSAESSQPSPARNIPLGTEMESVSTFDSTPLNKRKLSHQPPGQELTWITAPPASEASPEPIDTPPSTDCVPPVKQHSSPWPTTAKWQAFSEECQALVHRFLHKPLPGQQLSAGEIARPFHGAVHMSRAALWIPVLLTLYREAGDQEALDFPDNWLPYVMKAALLHDSGREGEAEDTKQWERASGEQCEDHLRAIGCPPELAARCRLAIINKDKPHAEKSFIEKLVHDADCLEIMRCHYCFDMAQLDYYQAFKHLPGTEEQVYKLATQVRSVIAGQGDLPCQCKIANSEAPFDKPEKHELVACKDDEIKARLEFAPNALEAQVEWLKQHQTELYGLYCKSAGNYSPASPVPSLESMEKTSQALGGSQGTSANGQYLDRKSGKKYYVKEPAAESARNEVLMARLASALGLKVPVVHLVREQERTLVVSEWQDGLATDQNRLEQAAPDQLARLYLVAALLGNVDILGHACANTQVNARGELVALDWGEAGEFGAPLASVRKTDSFSATVLELDTLLNAQHPAVEKTCHDSVMPAYEKAVEVFRKLDRKSIEAVVTDLLHRDTSELSRLIEVYGPDKPLDRQRLQSIIHDRLAYLARRFPQCCQERVTPAEHRAIVANGVRGLRLSVPASDITDGELCLFQFMDKDNQPVTECWLRLEPEVARKLSDRMELPYRHIRLIEDIVAYLNGFSESEQPKVMTPQWQAIITGMIERCEQASRDIEANKSVLSSEKDTVSPGKARATPDKMITMINRAAGYFRELQKMPLGATLELSGHGISPSDLPATGFPERMNTQHYEYNETTHFALRNLRCSHGWDTGTQEHKVGHYHLTLPNNPDVEVQWFGAEQATKMFALERVLVLRAKGAGKEAADQILSGLSQLEIATDRPDCDQIQALYTEQLARLLQVDEELKLAKLTETNSKTRWLVQKMGWQSLPHWEDHHRMRSGRIQFYHPVNSCPSTALSKLGVRSFHKLNFLNTTTDESVLMSLLHSGGQLLSACERARTGIRLPPLHEDTKFGGLIHDMYSGGATKVCFRLKSADDIQGTIGLVIKPEVLGRTDLVAYPVATDANSRIARVRASGNTPGLATWRSLSSIKNDHEITCADSISLDEVETVQLPYGRREILHLLTSECGQWHDGRPLDTVVMANLESYLRQLTSTDSALSEQSKQLVKTLEPDQLEKLLLANPELLNNGQIKSLQGVPIGPESLRFIEFSKVNLSGVIFRGINFMDIHNIRATFHKFLLGDLVKHDFSNMEFEDCSPYWLNNNELRDHVYRNKYCAKGLAASETEEDQRSKEIDSLIADIICENETLWTLSSLQWPVSAYQFRLLMLCGYRCCQDQRQAMVDIVNNSIKADRETADQYTQVAVDVYHAILSEKDVYGERKRKISHLLHTLSDVFLMHKCHHQRNPQLIKVLIEALPNVVSSGIHCIDINFQPFIELLIIKFPFTAMELRQLADSFLILRDNLQRSMRGTSSEAKAAEKTKEDIIYILFGLMLVSGQPVSSRIFMKCHSDPVFKRLTRETKETEKIVLEAVDFRIYEYQRIAFSGMKLINCVFSPKCTVPYGAYIDAHIEFTDDFKTNHSNLYEQSRKAFESIDRSLRTGVEKCRSGRVDSMTKEEVISVAQWLMSSKIRDKQEDTSPLSIKNKEKLRQFDVSDEKAWRTLLQANPELTKGTLARVPDFLKSFEQASEEELL